MIADFGLSRIMEEEKLNMLTEICGTPGVSFSSCLVFLCFFTLVNWLFFFIVYGSRNFQEELVVPLSLFFLARGLFFILFYFE